MTQLTHLFRYERNEDCIGDFCPCCGCDQIDDLNEETGICDQCYMRYANPRPRSSVEAADAIDYDHSMDA